MLLKKEGKEMRKFIGVFALLITAVLYIGGYKEISAAEADSVAITKSNFPDKRVRKEISKSFDKNKDNVLSEEELKGARKLDLGAFYLSNEGTYNLKGISKLKRLSSLTVGADIIRNISEVTKMPQLDCLEISTSNSDDKMESLDLRNNVNLINLRISSGFIPIKVKSLPRGKKLQSLTLEECEIKKIALVAYLELRKVDFSYCDFQTLTIKNCPKLEKISGEDNKKMKKITLKNLPELKKLKIGSTKKLKKLSLPELPNLESIYIEEVKELKKLSLSKFSKLESIYIEKAKKLRTLTLPRLPELRKLNKLVWKRGKLKKIKFGEKKNLEYIYVSHNRLGGTWKLSKFPKLMEFECSYNKIKNIYARNHKCLREIICNYNKLKKLDLYNISPYIVHFKGNPHVTAYLREEYLATTYRDVSDRWSFRFDKSAKVHYKEPLR